MLDGLVSHIEVVVTTDGNARKQMRARLKRVEAKEKEAILVLVKTKHIFYSLHLLPPPPPPSSSSSIVDHTSNRGHDRFFLFFFTRLVACEHHKECRSWFNLSFKSIRLD